MISYRKNYFKIYFWQSISIVLGFASLFVVVPYLSTDKTLYGIYSVCTSFTIFFSYADLGFISAGVKYASEYFIRNDKKNEMKMIGFTAFIMISAFAVVAFSILVIAIFPDILIPDLKVDSDGYKLARDLLMILAISCPIIIGQRILGIVFTIRVEDYIYQRMMIVGNIARILSVLYFFRDGQYQVIEYYIFYQAINFLVVIYGLFYTRHYGYSVMEFLRTIHFDKIIFNKVKKISGTSLIMTISMILYYELDQIAISHWMGIEAVAVYGVALSVLTLVRTFCSLIFSPYASRYNHYVGLNDMNSLAAFVNKMILMFGLVLIVPIATISFFAEPFVISWIGDQYVESAILVSLMTWSFASNFVKEPICSYFVATERNKILLKCNCLMPAVYWIGIIATNNLLGLNSFALFKFIAPTTIAIFYWRLAREDFKKKGNSLVSVKEVFLPLVYPIFILGILSFFISPHMYFVHNKVALLLNITIMGACLTISFIVGTLSNKTLRLEASKVMASILIKLRK